MCLKKGLSKSKTGLLSGQMSVANTHTMKNALAVSIPRFNDRGLRVAAAAGALIADPDKGLMVLKGLSKREIKQAKMFVSQGKVEIIADGSKKDLFIQANIYSKNGHAKARIEGSHTSLRSLRLMGL